MSRAGTFRFVVILVAAACMVGLLYWNSRAGRVPAPIVHTPDASMRREFVRLEDLLDSKDAATASAIAAYFQECMKNEDERTVLLQQRASSLLGTVSVVVTIVLGGMGLLIGDTRRRLGPRGSLVLGCIGVLTLGAFAASLEWTRRGFTVRDDFATHNVAALFGVMAEKEADARTLQTLLTIEDFQIHSVNAQVNASKAAALRGATANLFLGLFLFSLFCFVLLAGMKRDGNREVTNHVNPEEDSGQKDDSKDGRG